jgi:hypothetical protein
MRQIQKCLETEQKQRLLTNLAPQQVLEKVPLGQVLE